MNNNVAMNLKGNNIRVEFFLSFSRNTERMACICLGLAIAVVFICFQLVKLKLFVNIAVKFTQNLLNNKPGGQ